MKKKQVAAKHGYRRNTVIDRAYIEGMIDAGVWPVTCITKEVIYTDKTVVCTIEITYDGVKFQPTAKKIDFMLKTRTTGAK